MAARVLGELPAGEAEVATTSAVPVGASDSATE
jgi:hypothetical protein